MGFSINLRPSLKIPKGVSRRRKSKYRQTENKWSYYCYNEETGNVLLFNILIFDRNLRFEMS
jgi:hypothetical protein